MVANEGQAVVNRLVADYERQRADYFAFTQKLDGLLRELAHGAELAFESIEGRAKDPANLRGKLMRPEKDYRELREVTDLAGLRIVTTYQEDVEKAVQLIREEFEIDEANSVDKRKHLDPREFDYLTVSLIVSLKNPRSTLREWSNFAALKAEIQLRSALQHTWAQVSRALQYTREAQVPPELRRRLYRLMAMFEVADDEFSVIRVKHRELAERTESGVTAQELAIELSIESARRYLEQTTLVTKLAAQASDLGFTITEPDPFLPDFVLHCAALGVTRLAALDTLLAGTQPWAEEYLRELRQKAETWKGSRSYVALLVLLVAKADGLTLELLNEMGWTSWLAQRVFEVARDWGRRKGGSR